VGLLDRRTFLRATGALTVTGLAGTWSSATAAGTERWDLIVVGAGSAGLPAASFAARRGARVLLIDAADAVGGTLHLTNGQISGAGTRIQRDLGIEDTPDRHFEDVMRLSAGKADPDIVRLAVEHAGPVIDWLLDAGLKPLPSHPVTGEAPGRPGYGARRYLWAAEQGRAILALIERELAPELASGRVVAQLGAKVVGLLVDSAGAVEGVRVRQGERERLFRGRHVLLTSGGFSSNPQMFERLCGYPNAAAISYPWSQGDGIDLAVSVGGYLRGRDSFRCSFGSILTSDRYPAKITGQFITVPQTRPPWEIWVNVRGERFIREDEPSQPARERSLLGQPNLRYWIVFDHGVLTAAPPGVSGWSRERMAAAFADHPMFKSAATVGELAARSGIDAKGLRTSVDAYNRSVSSGHDPYGRTHLPRPLAEPPFYAIRHQGYSPTSPVGVAVDGRLRVLRGAGGHVPNLYVAGELLGSGATLGTAFAPGMMLTPALAFGRFLGSTLPLG